jgi:DNA-binding NarL/FixJ family response regulator
MDGLKEQLAEGRFDLIFLVLPPGTDYGASVRSVKSLGGRTPVAVLALVDTPSAIHSVIEAGASGFLPSMSPPQAIAHAVELMRSGGVYLPPSIFRTEASRPRGHDSAEPGPMQVTRRQRTVLRELAKGQSNKQIAGTLGLSEATIKAHIAAIMKSLKAQNRTQALLAATKAGILPESVD